MSNFESIPPNHDLKAELSVVLQTMKNASVDDFSFAESVDLDIYQPFHEFTKAKGIQLSDLDDYLIEDLQGELLTTVLSHKNLHKVPRPYVYAYRLGVDMPTLYKASMSGIGHSYPSGHAAMSRMYAHCLAYIFRDDLESEDLKRLYALADRIAESRLVLGVHYPSDLKEGKRLADEVFYSNI